MATSQKLKDRFLTCVICSDVFTFPSTLQCSHTFCRECLTKFTKTQPDAVKAKSIPCPFCRRLTKVPEPDKPVEAWAEQMKVFPVVQDLLDEFGPGAKDTSLCAVCKDEGKMSEATVWCPDCDTSLCDGCLEMHRRMPISRNHTVSQVSEKNTVHRRRKVTCKYHEDETVKLFCADCNKAICTVCCSIDHRPCKTVATVKSMLPEMRSTLQKGKQKLEDKKSEEESKVMKEQDEIDKMTGMSVKAKSEIKALIQKGHDLLEKKEKQMISEVDDVIEKKRGQLGAGVKTSQMAIQMYQQQCEFLNQALQSECDMDVCHLYQSTESDPTESIGNTDGDTARIVQISITQSMDKVSEALDSFHMAVEYDDVVDLQSPLVLQDTLNIKVSSDKRKPDPLDVVCHTVNGLKAIIVTDRNNNCIKSFYSKNKQPCHSRVNLDNSPWAVTKLQGNIFAVTVPDSKKIVTVDVTPDLALVSTIKTVKEYRGITAVNASTLAVGSVSINCHGVDIIDMTGKVLRSFTSNISSPYYLCLTNNGNIVISNYWSHSVICMSPAGDVLFTFKHPTNETGWWPLGVTTTRRGDILVAGEGLNTVIQLTPSGQYVREVLTSKDLNASPCGIGLDEQGKLFVTLQASDVLCFK